MTPDEELARLRSLLDEAPTVTEEGPVGDDFHLDFAPLLWWHPETGVVIADRDLPDELRPDAGAGALERLPRPLVDNWHLAALDLRATEQTLRDLTRWGGV